MSKVKSKKGFTIIEVVLVLAIAGLIFLMVFIALPAMQRSQRDTQRRDQLSGMMTQITQYQANNRNKLPEGTGAVTVGSNGKADETSGNKEWAKFYNAYLGPNNDELFEDPNGNSYTLNVSACTGANACPTIPTDFAAQNYVINVVTNANCDGEKVVYNSGSRKLAIVYKLEGGGTFCSNN